MGRSVASFEMRLGFSSKISIPCIDTIDTFSPFGSRSTSPWIRISTVPPAPHPCPSRNPFFPPLPILCASPSRLPSPSYARFPPSPSPGSTSLSIGWTFGFERDLLPFPPPVRTRSTGPRGCHSSTAFRVRHVRRRPSQANVGRLVRRRDVQDVRGEARR